MGRSGVFLTKEREATMETATMAKRQMHRANLEKASQDSKTDAEHQKALIVRRSEPEVYQALEEFRKLHTEFLNIAYKKLFVAKAAGELLLKIEQLGGFK